MSAAGQREALDFLEQTWMEEEHERAEAEGRAPRIPGLVSSHSWANDVTYQRILALDGHVAPMQTRASGFVDRWAERRQWAEDLAPDDDFGMGFGADTNGFASQPDPDDSVPVDYDDGFAAPIGDVTIRQQVSGTRAFDVTADGVAHYGLYADWFHQLVQVADREYPELGGGDQLRADMLRGAEHFLQMWERATYGGSECVTDHSTLQREDLHALLGGNLEGFLRAAGQPVDRDGDAYTYCVAGEDGTEVVDVVFDDDGRAREVHPGDDDITPAPAGDRHVHATATSLPATGGGAAAGAIALLGLALAGTQLLRGRTREA